MIQALLVKIGMGIVGLATIIGGWFGYQQQLGTVIPVSVAVFETTLSSKITTADTSMTLVTGVDKLNEPLNGYICFTLDGGKTNEEFVCGTASSTAVSGMIRGLSPVTASSSGILAKEHRAGSNVKITDWPSLGILSRILNGDEKIPNKLSYATNTLAFTPGSAQLPTVAYVDSVATSGAAQANFSVSGLVRLATTSELTVGTATSSATTYLVPNAGIFNQTSTATYIVPITGAGGKLSTGFIDQTGAYTWSGTTTFSASTTVSGQLTITGNATSTGTFGFATTTFSVIPIIPTTTPTTTGQVASYDYVNTFQKFTSSASTTGARVIGTYYLNGSTWRFVTIGGQVMVDAGTEYCYIYGEIGTTSTAMTKMAQIGEGSMGSAAPLFQNMILIVPPGYYYRATSTENGTVTCALNTWAEAY